MASWYPLVWCLALGLSQGRSAAAQSVSVSESGPYVSIGGGANISQDKIVRPSRPDEAAGRAMSVGLGTAGNLAAGYQFGNGMSLDIEAAYAHNRLKGALSAIQGETHFGGFANILYQLNLGLPVAPYLGLGAGYQRLELQDIAVRPMQHGAISPEAGALAYQGIAGVAYPFAALPGLSVTAEYRMIGANGMARESGATLSTGFNHQALFGLRYAFGVPPAPPPVLPAPLAEASALASALQSYLVFFDWDRADLSTRARQILADAANAATRISRIRIEVSGYTDLSASPAHNQRLSMSRGEHVVAELVRDGVPVTKIAIQGLDEALRVVIIADGPKTARIAVN